MNQCNYCTCRKPDIFKPQPDIKQHKDCGNGNRNDCIHTHLGAYGRTDVFSRNIFFFYSEFICHIFRKCFSFFQIQRLCLENDLITVCNGLYLDVWIICHLLQIRNHCFINLFQRICFVKCYICRCTTLKFQTVIEGAFSCSCIHSHKHKSNQDHCDRYCKENLTFSKEINRRTLFFNPSVKLWITNSNCIERIHDHPGDHKCGKHGYHNTKCQCLCESFDCTASFQPEHCCRDQCCNISIQNRRHCFVESSI